MGYATLFLLVTVIFLLYIHLSKKLNYFNDFGIPCVQAWSVLGNMALVVFRFQAFKILLEKIYYHNKEALYVGVFVLIRPTILLRDTDLIKSITIKNFNSFTDHVNVYSKSDRLWAENIFNLPYDKWREARSTINPAFSSRKMKDNMFNPMKDHVFNCLEYLSQRGVQENSMIETKDLFSRYVNDSVFACIFGVVTNSYTILDNDLYTITKKYLNLGKSIGIKFLLSRVAPRLLEIFNVKLIEKPVEKFFKQLVLEIVHMKRTNAPAHDYDMISLMLNARENDKRKMDFDLDQIVAQVIAVINAGLEATNIQLCCIAHELAINSDVQARLQQEIDEIMEDTEGNPTYNLIMKNMPYLDAVINETVRLHCVNSTIDRVCVKEFVLPPALPGLKPFVVKPGMPIWIPSAAIQRDEKHFDDPLKFDPDRYFLRKVDFNDGINLSFGIGPRQCFGRRFSIMQMKIMIFFLLQKFNLKPNTNTPSTLEYDGKIISLSAKSEFWLSILPRNMSES